MIKSECFQLLWSIIHKQALRATDRKKKEAFECFINNLALDFPCEKCKPHFQELLKDIPMNRFEGTKYNGVDISYFYWTFHLHNMVNLRLNKEMMLLEEAMDIHTKAACDNCEIEEDKKVKLKKNSQISSLLY